jgi:hypothetical protein
MWFMGIDFVNTDYLWTKGALNVNGILIINGVQGNLQVYTNQGAAFQLTNTVNNTFNAPFMHHLIVTRDGATCRIYAEGVEAAYAAVGVHINPVSAVGDNLYVYSRDVNTSNLDGYGSQVRVWEGRVLGAADAKTLYIYGPNRT